MNISSDEQRMPHALAQGGHIVARKDDRGRIIGFECYNREGRLLSRATLPLFNKLRRKSAVASREGGPYRITRRGLALVGSEADNR